VPSISSGYVASIDCDQVGLAVAMLGGGRQSTNDVIDPAVGVVLHKKAGDVVTENEPLVTVHFNAADQLEEACDLLYAAYHLTNSARYMPQPLVRKVIEGVPAKGTSAY
jgi:pyrimidine-nucleoside phosphorylase